MQSESAARRHASANSLNNSSASLQGAFSQSGHPVGAVRLAHLVPPLAWLPACALRRGRGPGKFPDDLPAGIDSDDAAHATEQERPDAARPEPVAPRPSGVPCGGRAGEDAESGHDIKMARQSAEANGTSGANPRRFIRKTHTPFPVYSAGSLASLPPQ